MSPIARSAGMHLVLALGEQQFDDRKSVLVSGYRDLVLPLSVLTTIHRLNSRGW